MDRANLPGGTDETRRRRADRMEVSTGSLVLIKAFGVRRPVTEPLLEKHWRVARPVVGSRGALEVTFDRVMDDAIVADEIEVQRSDGTRFDGVQSLTMDGRQLVFQPAGRWEHSIRWRDKARLIYGCRMFAQEVCDRTSAVNW